MTKDEINTEINRLRSEIDEWRAQGGQHGDQDPHVQEQIDSRRAEIRRLMAIPPFWTVAIYLDDLAYGGPEEGGWYYGVGTRQDTSIEGLPDTMLLTVLPTEDAAYALCRHLNEVTLKEANKGRREISSVLSQGRYSAHVYQGYPPAGYPEETPHYE